MQEADSPFIAGSTLVDDELVGVVDLESVFTAVQGGA